MVWIFIFLKFHFLKDLEAERTKWRDIWQKLFNMSWSPLSLVNSHFFIKIMGKCTEPRHTNTIWGLIPMGTGDKPSFTRLTTNTRQKLVFHCGIWGKNVESIHLQGPGTQGIPNTESGEAQNCSCFPPLVWHWMASNRSLLLIEG